MRIDQVLVGASPGDAVTEAALRTRATLRTAVESGIYAVHVDETLKGEVGDLFADFPRDGDRGDVLIHHVSIGEPAVADFVLRSPGMVVAAYHNITPAHFFEATNPPFADRLRQGRAELAVLADRAIGAVADSTFNASELLAAGFTNVEVAPPPLNLSRLLDARPDTGYADSLAAEGALVLVVGQVLPHKRPELAVEVQHFLNVNHDAAARLVIAGSCRQQRYAEAVTRHVESMRLDSVHLTGPISDARLAALFRRADVLLVPSEHEGFCVPLVEAMLHGVPIVARDYGAIAETAGDAALVLPQDAGAPELAEATARVIEDPELRAAMIERGSRRGEEFIRDATPTGWLEALARVLRGGTAGTSTQPA